MVTSRRVSALPLPQEELDKMAETLSPYYGGQVWEGAGSRILVVRVPRDEPDPVNDLEQSVEYLSPADTQDLTAALLVGLKRTLAVPVQPFTDLMARRVQHDHDQCIELRRRIPGETGHLVYRHPADPKKVLRLGLRVPHDHVRSVSDTDSARWSTELGPGLKSGKYSGVRAVYLIARKDDVRIDGDLFFQDLRERVREDQERKDVAAQVVARQAAAPPPAPRVVYAPLKHIGTDAPAPAATADGKAVASTLPPVLQAAKEALQAAGYDVLVRPKARHAVDLAAERDGDDLQRVIVRAPERLTPEVAHEVLAAARGLDVDLALVVCEDADPAARRALIATKARWIRPADVADLNL
jgi:hypothetical protein